MKITLKNYAEATKKIDFKKLPEALRDGNKYIQEYGDLYSDDKDIKETIDLFLKQLNSAVASTPEVKKTKRTPAYRKYKNKKSAKTKVAKEKKHSEEKAPIEKGKYQAIFGDWDNDGIENVDDPNPNKAGDTETVEEVKLSDEIEALIDFRKDYEGKRNEFVSILGKSVGQDEVAILSRTKTPYSILNKLRRKRLVGKNGITDIVGTMVVFENKKDLEEFKDKVNGGALGEVLVFDDYYKSPLAGYKAYHWNIVYEGTPIELQAKTVRMKKIASANHTMYKEGKNNPELLLSLTELMERADEGDEVAISVIDSILDDEVELTDHLTSKNAMERLSLTKKAAKDLTDEMLEDHKKPVKIKQIPPAKGLSYKDMYETAVKNTLLKIDQNMTEEEVISLAMDVMNARKAYVAENDKGRDSKKRLTPTPENLIRWMKHAGQYDMIGVDTFKEGTATADYKRVASKQKLFNLFNIKI